MAMPMKILLAVDESAPSRAAEECLLSRPWPAHSVVRVLCVVPVVPPVASTVPPIVGAPMSFTPLSISNDIETQKVVQDSYAEVARSVCNALCDRGLNAEGRTRFGAAGPEIVAEAHDWSADLIVVGSHDLSKVKRLLLGSTASYVVQHARCSVEVARSPQDR